jgi:hypothetical protein
MKIPAKSRNSKIDLVKALMNLFVCGIKVRSSTLTLFSVINMLLILAILAIAVMAFCCLSLGYQAE